MQRGAVKSLSIWANTSPCAHICRFCQIGDRAAKRFPLERWRAQVERFRNWQQQSGADLIIDHGWPGPAYNFSLDDYVGLEDWLGERFTVIPLGGVKMRKPGAMREWLRARQARGLERVHGAFVGLADSHDAWVGRRGNFRFLLDTFRVASDIGMSYSVTLYLTRSTLSFLDALAEAFEALPNPPAYRHVRHFYYGGYAAQQEAERLTASDLPRIPPWAMASFREHFDIRTESDWMSEVAREKDLPVDVHLSVELTKDNIGRFEALSCDDIYQDLESRAIADLGKLPSLENLAREFARDESPRLYARFEVARLWVDRYLEKHPMDFDRSLLHEHIGLRDVAPPLLMAGRNEC